jgi:alpha-ketoglutarate-dependent taurine dioxygenase
MKSSLTFSKKGLLLSAKEFLESNDIKSLIQEHSFLVVKKLDLSVEDLEVLISKLGGLVKNEKRANGTLLELNGKLEAKEVLRGNGRMPLHRDGLLMQNNVKYTAIYCIDQAISSGGRTYISDTESAWHKVPKDMQELWSKNGIEILPYDTNYYLKNEEKWYPFEGTIEKNGKTYINGGLGYEPHERKSYDIRIKDIDIESSNQYFKRLEAILESDEFTYFHKWECGDLLLFDNLKVMHGREAYIGERNIVQVQVHH